MSGISLWNIARCITSDGYKDKDTVSVFANNGKCMTLTHYQDSDAEIEYCRMLNFRKNFIMRVLRGSLGSPK